MDLRKENKGYVKLKLWGQEPERLLSLCAHNHIEIWDIAARGKYLYLHMFLKDFYENKKLFKKSRVRAVVVERHGLPFLVPVLKKRSLFFLCFLCFLGVWLASSNMLLHIKLEGNYSLSDDVLYTFLEERGIRTGMWKKDIDLETLEKDIRQSFDIITWTSGKIDGTILTIYVKENEKYYLEEEPEEVSEEGSSLYATVDGTLYSMVIRKGISGLKAGDEIHAGDLILDGKVPVYDENQLIVNYQLYDADADILIDTVVPVSLTLEKTYLEKTYTGRTKKAYYLSIDGVSYRMPGADAGFSVCDRITEQERHITLFGHEIVLSTCLFREYTEIEHAYDRERAGQLLLEQFEKNNLLLEEKGVQIISKDVTIGIIMDKWALTGSMQVYMPAFERRPIELPEEIDDRTDQ